MKRKKTKSRMLKIALIICFSTLLTGCAMLGGTGKFDYPAEPKLEKIYLAEIPNGYFLTDSDAYKLANNIDELKAYIKKLEELIKVMEKHNR